jgi:hypothetical protein
MKNLKKLIVVRHQVDGYFDPTFPWDSCIQKWKNEILHVSDAIKQHIEGISKEAIVFLCTSSIVSRKTAQAIATQLEDIEPQKAIKSYEGREYSGLTLTSEYINLEFVVAVNAPKAEVLMLIGHLPSCETLSMVYGHCLSLRNCEGFVIDFKDGKAVNRTRIP